MHQCIILIGTPVYNTLKKPWMLFNFVSPGYLEGNPVFLQGNIESLKNSAASSALFVGKNGEITRPSHQAGLSVGLKGVQVNESSVDTSHELASIQKVYYHLFLITGPY